MWMFFFSSKAVLELIEKNYRIHCSLNEIVSMWAVQLDPLGRQESVLGTKDCYLNFSSFR